MDPALQELFAEGAADDEVAVILRLAEASVVPPGARIVARFGNIATCRLRRGDIPGVRAADAVHSMKAAQLLGPMDDEATDFLEHPGEEAPEPLPGDERRPDGALPTGSGVVVAHIDWGVDFAHPDFRTPDGRTRLLALWDQGQAMDEAHPNAYGYGRIYSAAEIDAALAQPDPYEALGYFPCHSDAGGGAHGSHTLGISGGNGSAGGPCGLAPEARLLFVHLSTYTADGPTRLGDSVAMLEALDFIDIAAMALPVVVNASIGKHAGEHDGKTLVEQGMDAFVQHRPGRAIVLSAGNYFKRASHAQGLLRPGARHILHLVADAERRTPTEVDLWYPGTDRLGITVSGPHGMAQVRAAPGGKASLVLEGREIGRLYHRIGDPNNGDNQVTLLLYAAAPPAHWEIELEGTDITDGRFHAWVERDPVCARCQAHFVEADSEPTGTTGTICNGLRTVAVGAYDAHRQERPLARFSSCGPTRDGRQKPDLVAPGVRVLSVRSTPRGGKPGPHLCRMSGTSMAAPHVTGTIALMFAAAGRLLAIDETRRLLLGNTEPVGADAGSLALLRIGSGMLDTAAAVAAARLTHQHSHGRTETMSETSEPGSESALPPVPGDSAEAERKERYSRERETAPLPFQVQLPIGGGAPALGIPIGGAGSPFAVSLPLGGTPQAPAPAPAAAAAPAPAPTAPVAALAAEPDPVAALRTDVPLYVAPTETFWAEAGDPGARPMLRRGARGPSVLEAQHKLNLVHSRGPGLAAAPLVEDGIFGERTHQATLSFQCLAFPNEPREWDGVIGPKTWATLDAMSAVPVPPFPLPVDPPIIPVVDQGCGNLSIWINAFIPQNVPGYTFTVPGGPHAGKTAIPCPTAVATIANPNCFRLGYLTDQRSFDTRPTASVRMRSLAEVQLMPPRLVRTAHVTSGTVEVNRSTGAVSCAQNADMRRCAFSNFNVAPVLMPAGSFRITMDYNGAASDPCVNLAADIDYNGHIEILCVPATGFLEVTVSGMVDSFPAFEMYAQLGASTVPIFVLPPPAGNTVVDLLGGASTPVGGRARFACSFGLPQSPTPQTALVPLEAESEAASEVSAEDWLGESAEPIPILAQAQAHECSCGDQRLARADAYARLPQRAPGTAAGLVEALLAGEGAAAEFAEADAADPAAAWMHGLPMSPTALFNAFSGGEHPQHPRAHQQRFLARRFEKLAGPGDLLSGIAPQVGDLLVRSARGEGWGNVGVVASHGLQTLDRLAAAGLRAEGGDRARPGSYAHVVELLPRPAPAASGLARRLADDGNAVLHDTMLLRPRTSTAVAAGGAESLDEAACGCVGTATEADWGETDPVVTGPACATLSQFANDSDALVPAHRGQIDAAAAGILARGTTSVAVTGFASSAGSNDYNMALGMRRAQRVATELRAALERRRPGSSAGVAIGTFSRGEEEQIAGGVAALNRRVTICPAAVPVPPPRPQPVPVQTKVFRITAKSFIAHIGSSVGTLSCGVDTPFGNVPSPLTNPALRAFAALTDTAFSENPLTDNIFVVPPPENKGYRLFSSARLQVEHRGTELVSVSVVGALLTDAGRECVPSTGACLQAPPLRVDLAPTMRRIDASRIRVSWGVRGRPPAATEPAFDAICRRSCVFIWHQVKATIDCSSGVPVMTSAVVEGSHFPSHRLWVDGTQMHTVPQGPLSGLWDAEPGDPTRVH